jgi:hypothetical protein
MNNSFRESAEREMDRAIIADGNANTQYYRVLRRFIPGVSGKPEAKLDSTGLKEIDVAWIKLESTNKSLRRAYMKLYGANL